MSFDTNMDDEVHVLGIGWVPRDDLHSATSGDGLHSFGVSHVPGVDLPDVNSPNTVTTYLAGVLRFLNVREK